MYRGDPNEKLSLDDTLLALKGLMSGEPDLVANAANCASLLAAQLDDVNWLGFYFLQGDELVLGPFQGLPACVRIPVGRGVCGTAVAEGTTQVVPDVFAFPGHIACDSRTRSEVVVPLHSPSGIVGVLDVDSPLPERFSAGDVNYIERVAEEFSRLQFG